ncbi:MAG: LapA family protein [Thermodesulfobacteriota bacterium]
MRWIKTLFIMAVFLFVILFSVQNKDEVVLRFGLFPIREESFELPKLPIFLIILCSVFFGILIGGLSDFYQRYQLKKALRQNLKIIERLNKEVESLRGVSTNRPSFLKDEPREE